MSRFSAEEGLISHPWPFTATSSPIHIARAEGAYLYQPDGKAILDAAGGAIVVNIGHGRREVAEAVYRASLNTTYTVPTWMTPERELLLEELHGYWLPAHLTRVHLTSGGSEANEAAMKIAIQYQAARGKPGKNRILARSLSYHGTTITTAGVSGHLARKRGLEAVLNEPETILTPYPLRCPLGSHHPDVCEFYLADLRETIRRVGAENIAALIAEPMNGSSGGAITPPEGYWVKAQEILRENDILLIMDEVMTGFGRTGTAMGSDLYGARPDLMVAGKGMAGGYAAIAGTYGTEEIAETIAGTDIQVMYHTFSALPQSCAAAAAVLKIIREESLVDAARKKGAALKAQLTDRLGQHPLVAEVRGEGLLLAIEVVQDRESLTQFPMDARVTDKIVGYSLAHGVFFYPGGTGEARDIICIGAPFIINDQDISKIVDTLEGALNMIVELSQAKSQG